MAVRSFCNADLPQLVRLWNEHWAAIGPDPMISMARFEQAVLARTYFDANSLLVFDSGTIEGCCLSFQGSKSSKSLCVGALCLSGQADPGIANQLLEHVEHQSDAGNFVQIEVGIVCDSRFGLAGLDPLGHGIGIPSHDFRITSVLSTTPSNGCAIRRDTQLLPLPGKPQRITMNSGNW